MFRKLISIAVTLIAATGLALAGAGIASANTGNAHFTATYTEPTASGGTVTWTCAGEHIVANSQVKEEENCALSGDTSQYVPGFYTGDPFGTFPGFPSSVTNVDWISDYNGQVATSYSIHINGNSSIAHIEAFYVS
jgi:hypothetical protein